MKDKSQLSSNEVLIPEADEAFKDIRAEPKQKGILNKTKLIVFSAISVMVLISIGLALQNSTNEQPKKPLVSFLQDEEDLDFTEEGHRQLSREIAAQTMVLATNNDGLPLRETDQVVLFGSGTENTIYGGWGSGEVYNKGTWSGLTPIKVKEGIQNKSNKFIYVVNNKGYEIGSSLTEADIQQFAVKTGKAERTVAILTISRLSGEGSDRPQDKGNTGTLLSDAEINTYNALIKYFDKIVMVLNVGSVIELNDIEKNEKTSILISFLPGMEAGNAIADVLVGDVNPSGHLTDTWAKTINDYPTTKTFTESIQYVKYKEGLFVGYRYFEDDSSTQGKVVFPFGHGLSYTTFNIKNQCTFNEGTRTFEVKSEVTNTGSRSGKQVVQVYAKKPQNENFIKVQRELVAFAKTKELNPGETQVLTMNFDLDYLASYDDTGVTGNKACYVLEKGEYVIYVGTSVAETRNDNNKVYTYEQKELQVVQRLANRVVPQDPDVADANKKPIFSELLLNNNEYKKVEKDYPQNKAFKEIKYRKIKNNYFRDDINNFPTDKFNEINFKTVLENKYTMEQLVDSMSNEELAYLSFGKDANIRGGTGILGGLYNTGMTRKYNLPGGDSMDGPAGLRQSEISLQSAGWPCSTALASSFDIDIMKKVGEETGKEARKLGGSFWLAPGMNIHRSPLCGRNFEYYSEDPFLTGMMATYISIGLQSKRVSITLKHFCVNNKEQNRNGDDVPDNQASDSRMAERVAREIYLKGFEIAVKKGDPWSIMTSYNRINGVKTDSSYDLLTGILREEWGYKGLVMTDWGSKSTNDVEAHAGTGVKMPSNGDGTATILNGIAAGTVTRDDLKRNILYVFNTISKTAAVDKLFKDPEKIVKLTDEPIKVKIFDNIYQKARGISYEACEDSDGGQNPTNTWGNQWISIYIDSDKEQTRQVRVRYSSVADGFGVAFLKYDENLGEKTNLENTTGWQIWKTSGYTTVRFPQGKYELTMRILSYDESGQDANKGNVNYIEIY